MSRLLIPALLGLALFGCVRPSPTVTYHTLSPLARPVPTDRPLALEIMPVRVPELLQRSQIVFQTDEGAYQLSATHRWGNTLEKDLQRVLGENLSALLGSPSVVPYPDGASSGTTFRVALDVSRCDGSPGGSLRFRASWRITRVDGAGRTVFRLTELVEPVRGQGMEGLVAAHDRVLERLSREIALALQELARTGP